MINQQIPLSYAPVVLFVYNRPAHTRKTIDALRKNGLSNKTDIFIYSDAAKSTEDSTYVQEVREYITAIDGFKSVNIIEQKDNMGLAASIITGVTTACEKYGKVIVLEDDIETSPYFLRYMNDALSLYAEDKKVMHISGCTYPVKEFCDESSYFLNLPLCWGWATWDHAWSNFSKNINIMERFSPKMISKFNFDDTYNYWDQLKLNRSGKFNTWFIFWYATVFLAGGLSLFPKKSMTRNIGMDGTGVHCGSTNDYDHKDIENERINLAPLPLQISQDAFAYHKVYFREINPNFYTKVIRKVFRLIRGSQ